MTIVHYLDIDFNEGHAVLHLGRIASNGMPFNAVENVEAPFSGLEDGYVMLRMPVRSGGVVEIETMGDVGQEGWF